MPALCQTEFLTVSACVSTHSSWAPPSGEGQSHFPSAQYLPGIQHLPPFISLETVLKDSLLAPIYG